MICKEYDALSHQEKVQFIGKLVHAVQNDSASFGYANSIIAVADSFGVFDKVKIAPNGEDKESSIG